MKFSLLHKEDSAPNREIGAEVTRWCTTLTSFGPNDAAATGLKGHVKEQIVKDSLFAPSDDAVAFLCGPPAMIQKAALRALRGMLTFVSNGRD
jgi:NAD(P)H-flavin reductase